MSLSSPLLPPMLTRLLPRNRPVSVSAAVVLLLCLFLSASHARVGMAQAEAAPVAPEKAAAAFIQLLTAKVVDTKTLGGTTAAELPFFRVRLYVTPVVSGTAWVGVDSSLFKKARAEGAKNPDLIKLAAPTGLFRDRLNRALSDRLSATSDSDEVGFRIVDVWCRHSDGAGGHVPVMAKVWFNDQLPGPPDDGGKPSVAGRLCHADAPEIVECLRALNAQVMLEKLSQEDMQSLSADPEAAQSLAKAIEIYRADIVALKVAPVDPKPRQTLTAGGMVIELRGTQDLPESHCDFDRTKTWISGSGDTFIGLTEAATSGKASMTIDLPPGHDLGGGTVWAPSIISDQTATLEVEVSKDGLAWSPLYRLDASSMEDEGQHVLPASVLTGASITIRAQLTPRADAAAAAGGNGLRYLAAAPPILSHYKLDRSADGIRVVPCEPVVGASPRQLRLVLQPKTLGSREIIELVNAGGACIDLYAPCQLDEDARRAIGRYAGAIRFWTLPDWKDVEEKRLKEMVSGAGWIIFPSMEEIPEDRARGVAAGKKSIGFPRVRTPSRELLAALATCSGELALDGIETLSTEQSLALSRYQGPKLSLASLHTAHLSPPPQESPSTPESLSRWRSFVMAVVEAPGTCTLSGLKELDEATATVLAAGHKHLVLDDVEALSEPVARALALTDQGLSLNGVKTLKSPEAAALLSFGGEYLSLAGLREVECVINDLTATGGRRQQSLRSLMKPPLTEEKIGTGMPLDAFVKTPGVFTLQSRLDGRRIGNSTFDETIAQTLAGGQKHLDLDCLVDDDMTPAIAQALALSAKIVSLDGIQAVSAQAAAGLLRYQGPMLSLANFKAVDDGAANSLEPLVTAGRTCLPVAGMFNIAELRSFVENPLTAQVVLGAEQKKAVESCRRLTKKRVWVFVNGNKLDAKASLVLPDVVELEDKIGGKQRYPRKALLKASQTFLETLIDNATEVAAARKEVLFKESLRPVVAADSAELENADDAKALPKND